MTTRKSRVARMGVLIAAAALVASACGGGDGGDGGTSGGTAFADCADNPNTCNAAAADELQDGGEITMAIEKDINSWNLLSTEGNVFETGMVLKEVLPYTFYGTPDLNAAMNEDLLESAEQTSDDPLTIVYKIKQEAVWSDGTPITAEDFIYNWKVQNGTDCKDCATASTAGYDQVKSVTGSDDGKTVTVVFDRPFADWKQNWGSGGAMYPAHIAAEHGDLDTPKGLASSFKWFDENIPTYSAGPYKVDKFVKNQSVTLVPNDKFWGQKPVLDRVVFRIITDATQEPTALQNNEVQVIYPQPEVDLVEQVSNMPDVSYNIGTGLLWEHYDLNLESKALKDKALRQALFTAVDQQAIIDKTVGQFSEGIEPLKNRNFMPGQEGYVDTLSETGQGEGDIDAAKKILTDAGYKLEGGTLTDPKGKAIPEMRIVYTTGNEVRKNECELFAEAAKELGVTFKVEPIDDLGGVLSSGDYDAIVFAWVSSPYPFAGPVQNWTTGQGNNFGHYSNAEVDKLLNDAASSTDPAAATDMVNEADKLLSADAYVLPIYQKPTFLAASDKIGNIRNNSTLDGPTYNMGEWGLRK